MAWWISVETTKSTKRAVEEPFENDNCMPLCSHFWIHNALDEGCQDEAAIPDLIRYITKTSTRHLDGEVTWQNEH